MHRDGNWIYDYRVDDRHGKTIGWWGYLYWNGVAVDEMLKPEMDDWIRTPWGTLFWVNVPQMVNGVHGWMPEPRTASHVGRELHLPLTTTPATSPYDR